MIRNPIDQRHANRRDVDCPVFWRRVGGKIALFFAMYPWVTVIVCSAEVVVRRNPTLFGSTLPPILGNLLTPAFLEMAALALVVPGMLLFLVGGAWWGITLSAWRRGFVSGWLWLVCTILGFGGTAALLVIPVLLGDSWV